MGWCTWRRVIHCLWSVSKALLQAWHQWEELLIVSISHFLVLLCQFLTTVLSQIPPKIPDYMWHSLYIINWMLHRKESQTLIMKCFKTSQTVDRWHCLPYTDGYHCASSHRGQYLILAYKIQDLGYPLKMINGMLYCKERHPLLMKCFKTFLS